MHIHIYISKSISVGLTLSLSMRGVFFIPRAVSLSCFYKTVCSLHVEYYMYIYVSIYRVYLDIYTYMYFYILLLVSIYSRIHGFPRSSNKIE